jgi:hypothetical protein
MEALRKRNKGNLELQNIIWDFELLNIKFENDFTNLFQYFLVRFVDCER